MPFYEALSRAQSACSWQSQMRASSPWLGYSTRPAAQDRQECRSLRTFIRKQPLTDGSRDIVIYSQCSFDGSWPAVRLSKQLR